MTNSGTVHCTSGRRSFWSAPLNSRKWNQRTSVFCSYSTNLYSKSRATHAHACLNYKVHRYAYGVSNGRATSLQSPVRVFRVMGRVFLRVLQVAGLAFRRRASRSARPPASTRPRRATSARRGGRRAAAISSDPAAPSARAAATAPGSRRLQPRARTA